MRPNESFVGQPIRSLQQMLRVIAENDDRQPSVVPDGIYGNDTVRAVSALQRSAGLPVTGIADQDTWDAAVARYEIALIEQLEAEPLRIILEPGQVIRQGESNPNLYIIQAILLVLSQQYPGITQPGMSGVLDLATADSISSFQQMNLIPVTGELDKHTWKALALHYPMAANALQQPK
jgi:peptidoglycan hydrolase-like protein with peptidoglycan-binding domain